MCARECPTISARMHVSAVSVHERYNGRTDQVAHPCMVRLCRRSQTADRGRSAAGRRKKPLVSGIEVSTSARVVYIVRSKLITAATTLHTSTMTSASSPGSSHALVPVGSQAAGSGEAPHASSRPRAASPDERPPPIAEARATPAPRWDWDEAAGGDDVALLLIWGTGSTSHINPSLADHRLLPSPVGLWRAYQAQQGLGKAM